MRTNTFVKRLLRDQQGATAIEYGLILALIAIATITALQGLANETETMWNDVGTRVVEASTNARG